MKNHLICLPVLALLAWGGCKPCDDPANPECRNYDPCYVQGAVSAEFTMEEARNFWPERLPIFRSVSASNWVVLRAVQELDSYEWQVGTEPAPRTGREIAVSFGWVAYGRVPIRLIARGAPNLACDPDDDGIDTVTREIMVLDREESPISGRFRGRHTHLPAEPDFEVEIRLRGPIPYMDSVPVPAFVFPEYYIMNLPNKTPHIPDNVTFTREQLYSNFGPLGALEGGEGFFFPFSPWIGSYSFYPRGMGRLSRSYDTLVIRYTIYDSALYLATPQQLVRTDTLTFIGIRQ
ncbi:MAG: hypothetical protein NW241_09625 [Bacteroidia bacterium]|nr:hypothetical protein [Bacteroidia bacterium]